MPYTLTQAAEAAGVGRSTVFKWIKAGKVSATKADDGTFRIDPAELHRFLDSNAKAPAQPETAKQPDTAPERLDTPPGYVSEAEVQLVALRSQLDALKQILEMERERGREWRTDRDAWKQQAERLALAPPAPATQPPASTPIQPGSRGWWPFRRSA